METQKTFLHCAEMTTSPNRSTYWSFYIIQNLQKNEYVLWELYRREILKKAGILPYFFPPSNILETLKHGSCNDFTMSPFQWNYWSTGLIS